MRSENLKTKAEWEEAITKITTEIHQSFPELTKYINEMPVKISENDGVDVTIKNLEDFYYSLLNVVNNYSNTHTIQKTMKNEKKKTPPEYPLYPPSEDIYTEGKKEMDINPEDITKTKTPNEEEGTVNEKDFEDDMSGDDLDVPGSELDDQQEKIGSEDEENNYYSLGGDNHNDLDEDKG